MCTVVLLRVVTPRVTSGWSGRQSGKRINRQAVAGACVERRCGARAVRSEELIDDDDSFIPANYL